MIPGGMSGAYKNKNIVKLNFSILRGHRHDFLKLFLKHNQEKDLVMEGEIRLLY